MNIKTKGFKLRHKLVNVFNWFIQRNKRRRAAYKRLKPSIGAISRIRKWARGLCSRKKNSGYVRAGHDETEEELKLPKGHIVVYVGDGEDEKCRVLVPVIYFNHPLFGELLREAEKVYGYDYSGGIQIPCLKSELESIQIKIAGVCGGFGGTRWGKKLG